MESILKRKRQSKEIMAEQQRKWHKKYPEKEKEYRLRKKYDLTFERVDEMLIAQNHRCEICSKSLIETRRCIDHDHKTGKVRGILCHDCNIGLGEFKEDVKLLQNAIIYLSILR